MSKAKLYTSKHYGAHDVNAVCPVCKINKLGEHPAISRGGNSLLICSNCGTNEALIIFGLQQGWLKPDDVKTVKI